MKKKSFAVVQTCSSTDGNSDRKKYSEYGVEFYPVVVGHVLKRYHGEILAFADTGLPTDDQRSQLPIESMESEWGTSWTLLLKFPDQKDALAWYHFDEYTQLKRHLLVSASNTAMVIMQGYYSKFARNRTLNRN